MIVIALEGCHGTGKTSLLTEFATRGYRVMQEGFLDMPSVDGLLPQSMTMEMNWMNHWFQTILKEFAEEKKKNNKHAKPSILLTDRSPFSAVHYMKTNGHLVKEMIDVQIKELEKIGIFIYTVHVKCHVDALWKRIQRRLEQEPERKEFNEYSREWMIEIYDKYNASSSSWNLTIWNETHEPTAISKSVVHPQVVSKLQEYMNSLVQSHASVHPSVG
jgi:deoxyadenosine/deoxycytidine kinase